MTRRVAALGLAVLVALTVACAAGAPHVSDEVSGCPENYRHVEVEGNIFNYAGDILEGRNYVLVVAAESIDPEYQGIYVVGDGVTGHNPVVRDMVTDDEPLQVNPVLCVPVDRAVVVMVRMSYQHPEQAGENIECELIDRGIAGALADQGNTLAEGPALGRVALDNREISLTDLAFGGDRWYVAQCDWLYVPDGHVGGIPSLFPRPDEG